MASRPEARVVVRLVTDFGVNGGHLTPGLTVANLMALSIAREYAGVE